MTGAKLATGATIGGGDLFQATVVPPNPYIIAALLFGAIAFGLGFLARARSISWIATALTMLSAVDLILFAVNAPGQVRQATEQAFTLDMEIGFWVSLISYLIASLIGAAESFKLSQLPASTDPPNLQGLVTGAEPSASKVEPARFCPTCGSPRIPGKGFCANCGSSLDRQVSVVSSSSLQKYPPLPRQPMKPLTKLQKWLVLSGILAVISVAGIYETYNYYSSKPVTVFLDSNLPDESLFLDGVDISNRSGTGRGGYVNGTDFRRWDFVTTRTSHRIEITHESAQPWEGTINPGLFEKYIQIQAFVKPITYTVVFQTNPPEAQIDFGKGNTYTTGKVGTVQTQFMPGQYTATVTKPGFPPLTQSIYVGPNANQQYMFDLVAGKTAQEAQLAGRLTNATALFQQQQYDQALAECDAVLQIDPSNADAAKLRQQIQQTKSILGLH